MVRSLTFLIHEALGTHAAAAEDSVARFLRRVTSRVGQMRCGMTGHNVMLRYQPERLSLQCASCGYESPGWELSPPRAARSYPGAAAFSPPVTA